MKAFLKIGALMLLGLASSCEKNPDFDDDFKGDGFLRGRLVYTNRFAGIGTPLPVSSRIVYLALSPSDALNFKYSVTTDKDGYFLFDHLNKDKSYDVFFSDTLRKVRYSALKATVPLSDPFVLEAKNDTLSQNGFAITLRSSVSTSTPAAVGNTNVCVFNNRLLARADACTGSIFTLKTDEFGRAVQYNLRPATYYFYSTATLANQTFRVLDSLEVKAVGVTRKTLTLIPYSANRNGFDLTVTDGRLALQAGARVCVFTSALLAKVDTCLGSTQQLQTDSNGHVLAYNLTPRWYYFRITALYPGLTLKGYDSVEVRPTSIALKTIALAPYSSRRNGFVLSVTDALGTPLAGAQACMFNSAILSRADTAYTCAGSIQPFRTDANGQVAAYNLVPRRYYFRLKGSYGRLTLKGYDSLDVQPAGITIKAIRLR